MNACLPSPSEGGLSSVAIAVIISVVTSRRGQVVPTNATTLTSAGFASGFMGTVTSIGGPPMALVYKDGDPRTVRATIAAFFSIGVVITVTGFVLSGEIGHHELALTLVILPGVLAGLPLSSVLARHMSAAVMRLIPSWYTSPATTLAPKAMDARIAALAPASKPSTSAVGSRSAKPRCCASARATP
ncbi:MAG: sulfite exporter TauE/SafE family protein [Acidimicrobiia bacterium]|nr:sulfite exporter TauE/SafE family protein [Acidimicrobiia bacterium]